MALKPTAWSTVGVLWEHKQNEMSGVVSLGLLGEVKVYVRLNKSNHPNAPKYNIIARTEDLPLAKLTAPPATPATRQVRNAPVNGTAEDVVTCDDPHPQRADCMCTLPVMHKGDHQGVIPGGEIKTWTNTGEDLPF